MDGKHELLWQFILTAYKSDLSAQVKAVLAAGPLEDLLADHGEEYIDQVEKLAQEDHGFNLLLGGLWKNSMTDNVWQRVQAARKVIW